MTQFVHAPLRAFQPAAAIAAAYLRVKISSSGTISTAAATDFAIGTIEAIASGATDTPKPVRLRSAEGTVKMVANGAIAKGALVYGAAGGKVSATDNGNLEGIAFDSASADGDVIEVMRIAGGGPLPASLTDYGTVIMSAKVAPITDNTGGTASSTAAAITAGASYAQADIVAIKNILASILATMNNDLSNRTNAGQMSPT